MEVGFLGTGRMGKVMAANLLKAGHRVRVWDKSPEPLRELKRAGADIATVPLNVLEQAVLAAGESQSSELRRKLAQLARLAVQHPGAVAQLIEDIEAHNEADQRWQANQKLGKMVEELIKKQMSRADKDKMAADYLSSVGTALQQAGTRSTTGALS